MARVCQKGLIIVYQTNTDLSHSVTPFKWLYSHSLLNKSNIFLLLRLQLYTKVPILVHPTEKLSHLIVGRRILLTAIFWWASQPMYAVSKIRKLAINSNFKKLRVIGQVEWIKRQKKRACYFHLSLKKKPWNIPSSLDNADENESSLWKARASEKKSLDLK